MAEVLVLPDVSVRSEVTFPMVSIIVNMARRPRIALPTAEVSSRMRNVATSGTVPELRVRRIVRSLGVRYTSRTDELPGRPDLFLPRHRIAVFVHGCFWHGCRRCFVPPKRNRAWWRDKIACTQRRDRRKSHQLRQLGISTITLWEHDDVERIRRRLVSKLRRS